MELERLFEYEEWANRSALAAIPRGAERATRLMAHIIGAQELWLSRMQDRVARCVVWPEWNLDDCGRELDVCARDLRGFVASAPLERTFTYRTSKGEFFTSAVRDALIHLAFHGSYHRGQVAAAIREYGAEPAYTDYIHAVRTGKIRR